MTKSRCRWMALISLVMGAAACTPGFDEPSLVLDLRVLAMKAEPPEIILHASEDAAKPVTLSILIADPASPGRVLSCRLQSCVLSDINKRCEDPATTVVLAEGPCSDGVTAFDVTFPLDLIERVREADSTQGYSGLAVWVELVVTGGEEELHALKSVIFSTESPPGRTANRNPAITGLRLDEADPVLPADVPWQAGKTIRMEVARAADAKETYVLPTFDGGTVTLKEYMQFSFYSDSGKFSKSSTTDKPDNFMNVTADEEPPIDLFVDWTPEAGTAPATKQIRFWFVLDDGRGGVDWMLATGRAP